METTILTLLANLASLEHAYANYSDEISITESWEYYLAIEAIKAELGAVLA